MRQLLSYATAEVSDFDEHLANPFDARGDWGPSRQEQRRRFAASALFELPAADAGWLGEALKDVSVAPIVTAGSGRPLNALLRTDAYRTGAYPLSARPPGVQRNSFRSFGTAALDAPGNEDDSGLA